MIALNNRKPLAGMRVLVGRTRHQASALSSELKTLGADVIEIPFIEIRKPKSYKPLDSALKRIAEYDWLVLTSVNGVEALNARMKQLRKSPTTFGHLKIAAIGPATRKKIEQLGLEVSIVPPQYVAESVVESLRGVINRQRVLLARAKVARDVIPRELRKNGAQVDVVEVYETVLPQASQKALKAIMRDPKRRPHVITFTSSSTVRNFVRLLGGHGRSPHPVVDGIKLASIGPITSATLREFGLRVDVEAKEYTIPGLVHAIEGSCTSEDARPSAG